jgi:transposase InsO family protein
MHANATTTPLTRAQMDALLSSKTLSRRAAAAAYSVSETTVRRWLKRARESGLPSRRADRSSAASLRSNLPNLPSCATNAMLPATSFISTSRSWAASAAPASAPPATAPSANQAPMSKASTSPSTTTPASLAPVCFQTKRLPSVLHALHQAVSFYSAHGIKIQQLITDRGSTDRSKLFAAACLQLGLQHLLTKPDRPQTNGKAERFIQTLTREWAYARPYHSSNQRASFLTTFMPITSTPLSLRSAFSPSFLQTPQYCGQPLEVQHLGDGCIGLLLVIYFVGFECR